MPEKCILDPERDCLGLMEARRLEKELDRHKTDASESFTKQGERLGILETQMAVHQANYLNIIAKLDDLIAKVAAIESRPAKRWEGVVEKVIYLVAAALVGLLLGRLGLG